MRELEYQAIYLDNSITLIILYDFTVRHMDAFNNVGDIKKSFQENNGLHSSNAISVCIRLIGALVLSWYILTSFA